MGSSVFFALHVVLHQTAVGDLFHSRMQLMLAFCGFFCVFLCYTLLRYDVTVVIDFLVHSRV